MINLEKISQQEPYKIFLNYYNDALSNGQRNIEAICISSFNFETKQVESRYVNLKYIIDEEWIFFSNYRSKKASDFISHDQISGLFYWNFLDIQIRIKAHIRKTDYNFSDNHFLKRDPSKNAIAVSSKQSEQIDSYNNVISNYQEVLNNKDLLSKRPIYWGGYSFTPFYFEFWEGNSNRINKREIYIFENDSWEKSYLEP